MGDEVWLFLRGLVREAAHWDDFPARFAQKFPGVQTHCLDLPGNGAHWRESSPLTIPEMVELIRAEAAAKFPRREYQLFSISLGSMVALEWMHRYPGEIRAAVLVNTSVRGISPLHHRLSFGAWPLLLRIVAQPNPEKREQMILELTSNLAGEKRGLAASRAEVFRQRPVQRKNVLRQLLAAARYHPPSDKPGVPMLLLQSLGDRLVSPHCTIALANHWGLDPKIHATAGHDLPLDDPEWCLQRVEEWVRGR